MIGIATSRMVGINVSRLRYLYKRIAASSYSTTLVADDDTDIVIGDANTDLQIRVVYCAVRGSLGQSGEMIIESPYTNYVVPEVQNDYFYDDVGITTLTPSINGDGKIVLTITVDDSFEDDIEFGYNLEVIKDTKVESPADYGLLYNWYATDGLAPTGWHVPTYDEIETLITEAGGQLVAGGRLKTITLWDYPNTGATDEYGFSALPSGDVTDEGFGFRGSYGSIWTSTESDYEDGACFMGLYNYTSVAELSLLGNKKYIGRSVRFIRDDLEGYVEGETVTDEDGNEYDTVQIGDQVWLKQNWACTKYANGSDIPNVTDLEEWIALETGAYCSYNNE